MKVGVVQAAPVLHDREATITKSIELMKEAAALGVKLLAFPETWIPGYPWWIWLGAPAWGMQFVAKYHAESLDLKSSSVQRLQDAAEALSMSVVMGYSEKSGGSLYMGQMLIDSKGQIVMTRRKLKPTHVERTVFGEGDGSDIQVHDVDGWNVGALCCWEHLQPLTKYAMFSMNEQIHVASWPSFSLYKDMAYALGPQVNTAASQIYAVEGQCYVLAACATVSQAMIDMLCDSPDKHAFLKPGGGHAMIFGPDGRPLAEPLDESAEGILVADADPAMIAIAKSAADPVGHYSRPDVMHLVLNRRPTPTVVQAVAPPPVTTTSDDET